MYTTTRPFAIPLPAGIPFAVSIHGLAARLATLVDQRKLQGIRYPFPPLLTSAVLTKLAGASGIEVLAMWTRLRAADLALFWLLAASSSIAVETTCITSQTTQK